MSLLFSTIVVVAFLLRQTKLATRQLLGAR